MSQESVITENMAARFRQLLGLEEDSCLKAINCLRGERESLLAVDDSCGEWAHFFRLKDSHKALSLGVVSPGRLISLSRSVSTVCAFTELFAVARFFKDFPGYPGNKGIMPLFSNAVRNLPFRDGTFDLVDIDLGGFISARRFGKRQRIEYIRGLLKEAYRVLKDGGGIYFSSAGYFPRKFGCREYRGFRASPAFWTGMLRECGFNGIEEYLLYPDSASFNIMFKAEAACGPVLDNLPAEYRGRAWAVKKAVLRMSGSRFLSAFCPAYAIKAAKERSCSKN